MGQKKITVVNLLTYKSEKIFMSFAQTIRYFLILISYIIDIAKTINQFKEDQTFVICEI